MELILSLAALSKGLYDVVAMSLIGSVLSNLLLVLGESVVFAWSGKWSSTHLTLPWVGLPVFVLWCGGCTCSGCNGMHVRKENHMDMGSHCHGVFTQAAASWWVAPSTTPSASTQASIKWAVHSLVILGLRFASCAVAVTSTGAASCLRRDMPLGAAAAWKPPLVSAAGGGICSVSTAQCCRVHATLEPVPLLGSLQRKTTKVQVEP